jgi:Flp pilus assembly pilin Flp
MRGAPVTEYLMTWLQLRTDRQAVTALEYGLIAGVIVAVVVLGFHVLANSVSTSFSTTGTKL